MSDRIEEKRPHLGLDIHTFHSFCLDILRENVLASGLSVSGGIISRTNQLVWGLRNIDSFGFEHINLGNNSAEVVKAVIDGISAFRDELITPDILSEYLDRKRIAIFACFIKPGEWDNLISRQYQSACFRNVQHNLPFRDR